MSLPDPETTDAEPVEIDDEATLEEIPDDNPFKETIVDLKDDGKSWREVWETLEDAYNPVDKAAYDESFVKIPEFEIEVVVPDDKATSGERYETLTHADESKAAAEEWAESKPEVRRVECIDRIGMVKVG